ncbi:hypothetical protein V3D52_24490 [Pseudomonas putida]|uniref:hypothetical protein n=1 Tax=Pseudomonas putida TaxID=303 RepID=UPI0030CE72A7
MQRPEHLAHFASLFKKRELVDFMSAPWLVSNFDAHVWKYNFSFARDQELDWKVLMYDGSCLTDPCNEELLKSLKCWIIASTQNSATTNHTNGMRTQAIDFRRTLTLIDYILQCAEELQLIEHGLAALTYEIMCEISDQIGSSSYVAVSTYDWNRRLNEYCIKTLENTDPTTIDECLLNNPTLSDISPIQLEDNKLDIPLEIVPRVRAALFLSNVYHRVPVGGHNVSSVKISAELYKNTLAGKKRFKPTHRILGFVWRKETFMRELDSVPVTNGNRDRMTKRELVLYRSCFVSLQKIIKLGLSLPSLDDLRELATYKVAGTTMGRFKNVPTPIIFTAIQNGIEFHYEYGPKLLQSYVNIAKYSVKNRISITSIPDETIISLLEPSIAQAGVSQLGLSTRSAGNEPGSELKESKEIYFTSLRNNKGLLELIAVYFGAVQLVVGATMAKRGSELRGLDPETCLSEKHDYLIAPLSKSTRSLQGRRSRNARPIDPLASEMIQEIIHFQNELTKIGYIKEKLPLFSSPGVFGTSQLTPCDVYLYYKNIDLFCDYFQVDTDKLGRRFYIRQHQLRRFFALVFLNCGYGASIGILQWMFGHADPEHIWNYITEELPGKELQNTLSQALSERITTGGATHYTDVIGLIEETFNTRNVSIMDAEQLTEYLEFLIEGGQLTIEPQFLEDDNGFRVEIFTVVRKSDETG